MGKITNKKIIDTLLSLDEDNPDNRVTSEVFGYLFAILDGKSRCKPEDTFEVPPGSYGPEGKKNKNKFVTTAGLYLFNKLVIEKTSLFEKFKYINKPLDKKQIRKIATELSYAVNEDLVSLEDAKALYTKAQWLTDKAMLINPHESDGFNSIIPKIEKKKKELIKKYEKELAAKDVNVMTKIEKEVLEYGKELALKYDAADIYLSGMCNWHNHFKDVYIMKGTVKDPNPTSGYHFVDSSYSNGMSKKSYESIVRCQASGPYARGNLTQTGGANEKRFNKALQHVRIEKGDCGTKKYITIKITDDNFDRYIYSNIITPSGFITLNSQNKEKYLNKVLKLRFTSCCKRLKSGNICSICAGKLPEILDIENIGLLVNILGSTSKNIQMSSFHDSQVKTKKMDWKSAFGIN